jgi:hypothetical protein
MEVFMKSLGEWAQQMQKDGAAPFTLPESSSLGKRGSWVMVRPRPTPSTVFRAWTAGAQMLQIAQDEEPIDLSCDANMEVFMKSLGEWATYIRDSRHPLLPLTLLSQMALEWLTLGKLSITVLKHIDIDVSFDPPRSYDHDYTGVSTRRPRTLSIHFIIITLIMREDRVRHSSAEMFLLSEFTPTFLRSHELY